MGGHRFRPVGFSPHSDVVITAAARDRIFAFFPRVFLSLNVSCNTAGQLLIYPVGEIPELSERSLHPHSSGKNHGEEAYGNAWAALGARHRGSAPGLRVLSAPRRSRGWGWCWGRGSAAGASSWAAPGAALPGHGPCSRSAPGERRSPPGAAAFFGLRSGPGLPSAGNFPKLGEIPSQGQRLVQNSPSLVGKKNQKTKQKKMSFNVFCDDHR